MKSLDEIRRILCDHREELRCKHRVIRLGIFGSYVHGRQRRGSDIDLLADFEEPVSLLGLVDAELYLTRILRTKVDLVPGKDVRPELKEKIFGEVVYI